MATIFFCPETPIFFPRKKFLLHVLLFSQVFPDVLWPPVPSPKCLWPSRDHEACIRTNCSTGNGATVSHLKTVPWKIHTRSQLDTPNTNGIHPGKLENEPFSKNLFRCSHLQISQMSLGRYLLAWWCSFPFPGVQHDFFRMNQAFIFQGFFSLGMLFSLRIPVTWPKNDWFHINQTLPHGKTGREISAFSKISPWKHLLNCSFPHLFFEAKRGTSTSSPPISTSSTGPTVLGARDPNVLRDTLVLRCFTVNTTMSFEGWDFGKCIQRSSQHDFVLYVWSC